MSRSILASILLLAACTGPRVASAPPGSYLVVLDKTDATLRMIEPNSGHLRDLVSTGVGPHEAAAAPDGTLVVVCDYGGEAPGHTLTVFDPFARHVIDTIDLAPHTRPHGIAFLDQRSTVLVTSETSQALLEVDLRSGKVKRVIPTEAKLSHMLAVTPDRTRAFTANMSGNSVSAIDLASGKVLEVIETGKQPEAIAVTPDGNEVWVGHNEDDKLVVLDAHTLAKKAEFPCGQMPIRIAFVPNGKLALVSCAKSGEVAVIETATRTERTRILMPLGPSTQMGFAPGDPFNAMPAGLLCEPDGNFAFVACTTANQIAVIDLRTLEVRSVIPTGKQPDGMTWLYKREGYNRLDDRGR
ncbi:MAG: YncE family protein [Planctomycetes bacterium]|nr:YncE family protein [Planctomycetota bacterium]